MMSVLITLADKYCGLFGYFNQVYGDNCIRFVRYLQDDPKSAKLYHEIVLTIQHRLLSPDLVQLLSSLDNLAALHEKDGETQEAEPLLVELLAQLEQHVPTSHQLSQPERCLVGMPPPNRRERNISRF